jgi:membrane protein YqaA with SNARE-associated domain
MNNYKKPRVKRLRLLHQYYNYTGFYSFVGTSLKKTLVPISIFIFGILLIDRYFIDFNQIISDLTFTYSPFKILLVFFASESLLGLIPPEIFIAWSNKTSSPIFYLTILALLSYFGGIVSFFIGRSIAKLPSVYNYLEVKMKKHLKNIKKWGGFLIVVGALLPIPFSMTSIAAGTINYSFKYYLLFGLLRFARFYLYALAIYNIF